MIINKQAREATVKDIIVLASKDERFEEASDLDDDEINLLFKIVYLALSNIIRTYVAKGLPIHLHNIGKIKIKKVNKIALKHKNNIANKMGYNNFREVPKDKLVEMNTQSNKLIINELKATKRKINRPKVATFRIVDKNSKNK